MTEQPSPHAEPYPGEVLVPCDDAGPAEERKQTKRGVPRSPDSQLAIRWFTPRGRTALAELMEDLVHGDGRHAAEIVAELRREGALGAGPDLRGIDLRGLELANAQLAEADLRGARLAGTNLMRANLSGAQLERAVLRGAKLNGANLRGANLERADLREADLSDCNLEEAGLKGAKMRGAEVKRAWVRGVDFSAAFADGVDLSLVRRAAYRPPRSTVRLREGIGAPPGCEPVPHTQRLRPLVRPAPRAPRAGAPARPGPAPAPRAPGGTASLDAALAQLLLRRGEVERIVVQLGGQEVVLFAREQRQRPAA